MKILFLDDEEVRYEELCRRLPNLKVDRAADMEQFVCLLRDQDYDVIFLDHDLGHNTKTGMDCARFLVRHYKNKPTTCQVLVHSLNNIGANAMKFILTECDNLDVVLAPWAWKRLKVDQEGKVTLLALSVETFNKENG